MNKYGTKDDGSLLRLQLLLLRAVRADQIEGSGLYFPSPHYRSSGCSMHIRVRDVKEKHIHNIQSPCRPCFPPCCGKSSVFAVSSTVA
ncbi:hypothetical protein RRG08_065563 [Elysia crispata]|uniref:Uncharacterized protein n=1 Tax=Elysia crispata TaxID=231223 RepID=A0AAE0YS20_9GAST|nr:hypothetical protein RRG08_065563 [Elysia crispata]